MAEQPLNWVVAPDPGSTARGDVLLLADTRHRTSTDAAGVRHPGTKVPLTCEFMDRRAAPQPRPSPLLGARGAAPASGRGARPDVRVRRKSGLVRGHETISPGRWLGLRDRVSRLMVQQSANGVEEGGGS